MRRRKIILIIPVVIIAVVLIFIILNSAIFEKVNLELLNPGFEAIKESGKPEFWVGSQEEWFVDAEYSHGGKNCMRATTSWSWLKQEVAIKSNRHYILKAYIRSNITLSGKDYQNTIFSLECIDIWNRVITSDYAIVNATSSWQLKEALIYAPRGAKKIRIKLAKRKGEGSVWFDDVELVEFSSGLVLNPGFEILDESSKPKFWMEDREEPEGGWFVDTEYSHSGKKCRRATTSWSWLKQEISIKSGKCYALEAYIKSDIIMLEEDYYNTFLTLECVNGKNEIVSRNYGIVNATSSWQLKEALIYAPRGAKKIRIKLAKRKGEGSVWFDDVKLIEKPWYLKMKFVRKALKDKLFFIFYGCVYLILIVSLLRILLKRESRVKKG